MSLYDGMTVKKSLAPAALTNGTANGLAVDRAVNGGMQSAVLVIDAGVVTDGSHAVTLEDSPDGSTDWQAVSASQLQGSLPTLTSANDDAVHEVGIIDSRRYLRAVVTTSGATSGGIIGAHIALNAPRFSPVTHS